jgi:hypothetical protein
LVFQINWILQKIIEDIRQEIQNDDFEKLKSQVEDLKWLWKIWLQLKLMMNQIQIQWFKRSIKFNELKTYKKSYIFFNSF